MLSGDRVVSGCHLKEDAAIFEDGRAGMVGEELLERTSQFQRRDLRLRVRLHGDGYQPMRPDNWVMCAV